MTCHAVNQIVNDAFREFIERAIVTYRFGDIRLYSEIEPKVVWENSLNQYLKTENDVKVKYGGFLERELFDNNIPLSLHSEMPIYGKSARSGSSDLSLHEITAPPLWVHEGDMQRSLVAVLEIKYINYKAPKFWFDNGGIIADIEKLETLPDHIMKYLLLLDEASSVNADSANRIRERANNICILSNNDCLSSNGY